MPEKAFKTIKIEEKDLEKLKFLASASNKKLSVFLGELIKELFQIGCMFPNFNISYDNSVLANTVTITFSGRSKLLHGKGTEQEMQKAITEHIESLRRN